MNKNSPLLWLLLGASLLYLLSYFQPTPKTAPKPAPVPSKPAPPPKPAPRPEPPCPH